MGNKSSHTLITLDNLKKKEVRLCNTLGIVAIYSFLPEYTLKSYYISFLWEEGCKLGAGSI